MPRKYIKKLNPQKIKQTIQQGFEKFVIRNGDNECWGWKGCAPKNPGYGQFRYEGILEKAHRASWMIYFGDIPENVYVLHRCDNRLCSNPKHLFLGTNADNMRDMISKGRNKCIGQKGEKNPMAKLTADKVKEIRQMLAKKISPKVIAKDFDISYGHVFGLKQNMTWKDLA